MLEPDPEPPVNVRLVTDEGVEVPVQCVYDGPDEDGAAQWRVVDAPPGRYVQMRADTIPGCSSVVIQMPS